jgi:AcrR family transcriptional regulator
MGRRTDTRQRMVTSAAVLLRELGVRGTSFGRVLDHADAPRGSVAHHFPGGKTEMLRDAVLWAGRSAAGGMRAGTAAGRGPADVVGDVVRSYRETLEASAFRAGCPVGAVAHEGTADPELRGAVEEVVEDWRAALGEALTRAGCDADAAADLADLVISAVEGAILLARVDGSTAPLDRVERQLRDVIARAVASA